LNETGPVAHAYSSCYIFQGFKVPVNDFLSLSIMVENMEFSGRVRNTISGGSPQFSQGLPTTQPL